MRSENKLTLVFSNSSDTFRKNLKHKKREEMSDYLKLQLLTPHRHLNASSLNSSRTDGDVLAEVCGVLCS